MKSTLDFFWIGIPLAVFKRVRKAPDVKERLNKSTSCSELSFLSILKTLLGILYDVAVDLLTCSEERINLISSLLVGERKNKFHL